MMKKIVMKIEADEPLISKWQINYYLPNMSIAPTCSSFETHTHNEREHVGPKYIAVKPPNCGLYVHRVFTLYVI